MSVSVLLVAAITVNADFTCEVGKVRPELHSSGFGMRMGAYSNAYSNTLKRMNFALTRTHDWAILDASHRVCDYFMMFPLMNKDVADPQNYRFEETDYLLKRNRDCLGLDIFYRLGTSIEHTGPDHHFNAAIPTDYDKVAEIFAATIRHYNRGWANGFNWNIKYWEIWNEPDGINTMWCLPEGDLVKSGDKETQIERDERRRKTFCKFFAKTLARLKGEFGDSIKVGGPAMGWMYEKYFAEIIEASEALGVKPDFISWHHYCEDPKEIADAIKSARKLCDSLGCQDTELIINEWHYFSYSDYDWYAFKSSDPEIQRKIWNGPRSHNGIDSSCFNLAVLSQMQYSDLDQGYYYGCKYFGNWGFVSDQKQPFKVRDGLWLFGDFIATGCRTLCKAEDFDPEKEPVVTVLAAKTEDGKKKALLISDYRVRTDEIKVKVKGIDSTTKVTVKVHDYTHDLVDADFVLENDVLTLKKSDQESAAYLAVFE